MTTLGTVLYMTLRYAGFAILAITAYLLVQVIEILLPDGGWGSLSQSVMLTEGQISTMLLMLVFAALTGASNYIVARDGVSEDSRVLAIFQGLQVYAWVFGSAVGLLLFVVGGLNLLDGNNSWNLVLLLAPAFMFLPGWLASED